MTIDLLVQEDGFEIVLEDGSGSLLLESSTAIVTVGPDIFVMIHENGDTNMFVYSRNDSKIYLNSKQDIEVIV